MAEAVPTPEGPPAGEPETASKVLLASDTPLYATVVSEPIPASPLPGERASGTAAPPRSGQRRIALALFAVVTILFLWVVAPILPPFLIAFVLAALLDPTVRFLEGKGRSRMRAILTLYALGAAFFILVAILVVPHVIAQIQDLTTNFNTYSDHIRQSTNSLLVHITPLLAKVGIQEKPSDILSQKSGPVQAAVAAALGGLTIFLQSAMSRIFWLIIIPLSTFFILRDYPMIRARIIFLFPEAYQDKIDEMSREIVEVFGAYLRGLTKICGLFALAAFVLFSLLGVRYALFLGLVAGAFYAVPYIGQLCNAIASGTVAFLMERHTVLFFFHPGQHSMGYALAVALGVILLQNIFDQLVYPRVVGGSVGLHPVVSIFALMAGATLFNIWGMLIAVPVAASIQILLTSLFPKLIQAPPERLLEAPPR